MITKEMMKGKGFDQGRAVTGDICVDRKITEVKIDGFVKSRYSGENRSPGDL
jgi:hypothetical protein